MLTKEINNRIKEFLDYKNINYEALANELGISKKKLVKKLDGKLSFTLEEATKIKNYLNLDLDLADKIFFHPNFKVKI